MELLGGNRVLGRRESQEVSEGDFIEAVLATTAEYRKGEEVVQHPPDRGVAVTEIFAMPHVDQAEHPVLVDVHFMVIGIDPEKVDDLNLSDRMLAWCRGHVDLVASGPSYITLGAEVGSQDLAFRIMALGEHLGFWDVITPEKLGITDPIDAREFAGRGMVMTSGWRDG